MCVQYWPASKEIEETYGGIHVSIMHDEELAHFHIRTFKLFKKEQDVSIVPNILLYLNLSPNGSDLK